MGLVFIGLLSIYSFVFVGIVIMWILDVSVGVVVVGCGVGEVIGNIGFFNVVGSIGWVVTVFGGVGFFGIILVVCCGSMLIIIVFFMFGVIVGVLLLFFDVVELFFEGDWVMVIGFWGVAIFWLLGYINY